MYCLVAAVGKLALLPGDSMFQSIIAYLYLLEKDNKVFYSDRIGFNHKVNCK